MPKFTGKKGGEMKYTMSVAYAAMGHFDVEADSIDEAMEKGYIQNQDTYDCFESSIEPEEDTELVVWLAEDNKIHLKMSLYELQDNDEVKG